MGGVVGLLPAAGKGLRMFPEGGSKELLPLGGRSVKRDGQWLRTPKLVIDHIIETMRCAEVERLVVVTNRAKIHSLVEHIEAGGSGLRISYVIGEPPSMLHAVDMALPWLEGATVLLGMPDTVVSPQDAGRRLLTHHATSNAALSLGLFPTDEPQRFGIVTIDEHLIIQTHADKPNATDGALMWGLASWGSEFSSLVGRLVPRLTNTGNEIPFGTAIDEALRGNLKCTGLPIDGGRYFDVGTYQHYTEAVSALWTSLD